MKGLIQYTTAEAATPASSPYVAHSFYDLPKPWADSLAAGDMQNIYLKPYDYLNPKTKSDRNVSVAKSGVVEIRWMGKVDFWEFACSRVLESREVGKENEYAVYKALVDAADKGVVLTWYPNIDAHPFEFYSCILEKVADPTRIKSQMLFTFKFRVQILPSVQFPSTVPPFV